MTMVAQAGVAERVIMEASGLEYAVSRTGSDQGILLLKREEKTDAVPIRRGHCHHRVEPPHLPLGDRMFHCRACRRTCNERTNTPFNHLQAPTDVAVLIVLWRLQDKLSLRNVAEMVLTRGFTFSAPAPTSTTPTPSPNNAAPSRTAGLRCATAATDGLAASVGRLPLPTVSGRACVS